MTRRTSAGGSDATARTAAAAASASSSSSSSKEHGGDIQARTQRTGSVTDAPPLQQQQLLLQTPSPSVAAGLFVPCYGVSLLEAVLAARAAAARDAAVTTRAAVLLQSVARMRAQRRAYARVRRAVLCLQRVYRGHLARRAVARVRAAAQHAYVTALFAWFATRIQAVYRGYHVRAHVSSYYATKRYVHDVTQRAQAVRALSCAVNAEVQRARARDAQARDARAYARATSQLHFALSTAAIPGVYARPARVAAGTSLTADTTTTTTTTNATNDGSVQQVDSGTCSDACKTSDNTLYNGINDNNSNDDDTTASVEADIRRNAALARQAAAAQAPTQHSSQQQHTTTRNKLQLLPPLQPPQRPRKPRSAATAMVTQQAHVDVDNVVDKTKVHEAACVWANADALPLPSSRPLVTSTRRDAAATRRDKSNNNSNNNNNKSAAARTAPVTSSSSSFCRAFAVQPHVCADLPAPAHDVRESAALQRMVDAHYVRLLHGNAPPFRVPRTV